MAITRSQQAKQMLRKGGRIGLQGGGRDMSTVSAKDIGIGDSESKREYSPSEVKEQRATQRLNERLERDRGKRQKQLGVFREKFVNKPLKNLPEMKGFSKFLNPFYNFAVRPGLEASNKLTREFNFDQAALAGRYTYTDPETGEEFTFDQNLALTDPEMFERASKQLIRDRLSGKVDAFGNPKVLTDSNDAYIFPRSGIMAEAPSDMDQEPSEDEKQLNKLRLAFRADGGRIGLQEGGGIEQRLEKLGGDVSSAEQMLQGINQRLKTAESSLGSGGGGIGALPDTGFANVTVPPPPPGVTPTPLPSDKNFFMGNASDMDSLKAAYANAQKQAQESRKFMPNAQVVLPGEMSFEAFSSGFNPSNPSGLLNQLVQKQTPLGVDNMGFNFRQPGDMGRYIADNDPGQQFAGYSSYQDYLNAGNDPVERKQGPQQLLAAGVETIQTGQPIQMSAQQALENQGRIPSLSLAELFPNVGQKKIDPFPMRGGPQMLRGSGIPAAGFADGGDVVGGEYDFESARQAYGLGKLVKKVTRTVKKIAKSPVGKAALIGGGGYLLGGGIIPGVSGKFLPFAKYGSSAGSGFGFGNILPNILNIAKMPGLAEKAFSMGTAGKALTGIAAASALAGLLTPAQEKQAQELAEEEGIDIEAARNSILARAQGNIPGDLRATAFLAEGGKPEPVAKKTMPLLDMGGKEMDLREEGGFVPIGRMEKADDVPARLSKNEFVFTADAVRNAGDGDVDKGAEVMYNMMKNLEAGGEVSEESQGLEGARKMFQTSQRLEEVL